MGWSLDYRKPSDPDLLDAHFLALGKALYLATAFEGKCRFLVRAWKIVESFQDTGDSSAALALADGLRLHQLGPTIDRLTSIPFVTPEHITVLKRSKDARNYIAHEAGGIGSLHIPRKALEDSLHRLRAEVLALIPGDNLVSGWVYQLEEKEPAPARIRDAYPEWVERWVFGAN